MQHLTTRIQAALEAAVAAGEAQGCPPTLALAIRHAVFPGGARIRPQLCVAVALACGDDTPELTDTVAAAIELLHCASLVHDDLPAFDDAPTRRGVPTVHRLHGERVAILVGDALIVRAFQSLAAGAARAPQRLAPILETLGRGVGMPLGIVAGQAWECEPQVDLGDYQRAKTGSLFAAATMAGAQAAGSDPAPWRAFGDWLGEAYQVADDIRDAAADAEQIGKPTGRDVALGRPSIARELGVREAIRRFDRLVAGTAAAIPACRGAAQLRALVGIESERLVPKAWARRLDRMAA
ncbi:MAG TPA: polyprenyl synthetase family protein [Caldimonas sp.]|nr:polyprenyl synthetase family protein [Caldimonas sp.]